MHTFKAGEKLWYIAINVTAVKRVRAVLNVDLVKLIEDGLKPLGNLLNDPCLLVDVGYLLCKEQADKEGVTDEQFGSSMAGDAIGALADAFLEELICFFQDPKIRANLKEVIRKSKIVRDRVIEQGERTLAGIDPEETARTLISSLTSAPVSAELTLDRSPSAN